MHPRSAAMGITPAMAQLRIYAEESHVAPLVASALTRVRSFFSNRAWHGAHAKLALRVDNLLGHRLAEFQDAGPVTQITLPAGTCVVTAIRGDMQRGYTLTLEPGRSFDLHLNHWPDLT